MKELLLSLVTTNSGWLIRQALKGLTAASAALAAYLATKGVDGELITSVSAAVIAGGSWVVETALSYIARKYPVK